MFRFGPRASVRVLPIALAAGLIVCLAMSATGHEGLPEIVVDKSATNGAVDIGRSRDPQTFATMSRMEDTELARKWRAVKAAIDAEIGVMTFCRAEPQRCPLPAALRFNTIVDAARTRTGRARLGEINRAINLAIRPMPDMIQHGVTDVWSSPLAAFASGAGDCEDYAIAKYVALKEAGFATGDLRLLIVRNDLLQEDHAVVGVRHDGRWFILDNRRMALLEERHFDLRPLFALDREGVKSFVPAMASSGGPSNLPVLM